MQFRHFYRKRSGRRKPEKETGWQQQVSLWTWLFFSIKNSQKVLHAQGFWKAHRYYPADDEICPRSERQVPAVSTASPWNQRNSFWISVSSATEYPSFWQMDSICLFGIPVFGFLSSKYRIFDNNWAIEQNFEQLTLWHCHCFSICSFDESSFLSSSPVPESSGKILRWLYVPSGMHHDLQFLEIPYQF